jgi:hypothetical protein
MEGFCNFGRGQIVGAHLAGASAMKTACRFFRFFESNVSEEAKINIDSKRS